MAVIIHQPAIRFGSPEAESKAGQVIGETESIWRLHPDWRLGKLIANIVAWSEQDVWDIEENDLQAKMERHLKQARVPEAK